MAKDKQTNIWGYMPEVEKDIKIIKTVCKIGGLTEDEINEEINKVKINKQKQDDVVKLHGRQNNIEYQLSEKNSFFWSFLIEFSRLTQENKKKAKK